MIPVKKLLILLSVAALLLAGCGKKEDTEETKGQEASVPPMSINAGKAEAAEPMDEDIVIPITQPGG